MKNYKIFIVLATFALNVEAADLQLYPGEKRKNTDVALYYPWNYPGFFGNLQIFTVTLDDHNYEQDGGMGNVPASGKRTKILPGRHTVRVSFVDSSHVFLMGLNQSGVFSGWYELTFEAKPGMLYAPIFNMKNGKENLVDEMCIAEVIQKKGLGATRKQIEYIACVKPTVDPKVDKGERCKTWTPGSAPGSLTNSCRHDVGTKSGSGEQASDSQR